MIQKNKSNNVTGFTLIEMLLVLVIVSALIFMSIGYLQQKTLQMRVDRTVLQMQQILNAALAFYVSNGYWPCTAMFGTSSPPPGTICEVGNMSGPGSANLQYYLPSTMANNPWGQTYGYGGGVNAAANIFFTYAPLPPMSNVVEIADMIVGGLPLAYTATTISNGLPTQATCSENAVCYVVTQVTIPGNNLNNASAVNFAGIYHHGGCVPVPPCPQNMTANVMVVPVSVSGVNDAGSTNVYPISSFTAYAMSPSSSPAACSTGGSAPACPTDGAVNPSYWRVCLQVITEKGNVASTNLATSSTAWWGQYATVAAFTRCSIQNEPSGSPLGVFSN